MAHLVYSETHSIPLGSATDMTDYHILPNGGAPLLGKLIQLFIHPSYNRLPRSGSREKMNSVIYVTVNVR